MNPTNNSSIKQFNHFFFIGIAGTGMSAIAQYLKGTGKKVSGSDRLFSNDKKMLIQEQFEKQGIKCFFQDASGIDKTIDVIVISTAIEESNIELQKARQLGITVMKRSELLAAISKEKRTIAVGGTSGKSTTTAMIFHILKENGYDPSLMTGAGLASLQKQGLPGNAWVGKSDWLVIEADESDGSIVNYVPEISVVLNIERDHKEFDELIHLFQTFKNNTRDKFIVNRDYKETAALSQNIQTDFGTNEDIGFKGTDFFQKGFSIQFSVNNIQFSIPVIGKHNMENGLAATAVAAATGIPVEKSANALKTYDGIYRRTQLIGEKNGVYVIDDFAHNPSEVAAAIKACQAVGKRVFAWFQPHGFGPLKFMHRELAEDVIKTIRKDDFFILSDVYYAGGTVNKEVTSADVIKLINQKISNAVLIENRNELHSFFTKNIKPGDVILLMGARDPSLEEFAKNILDTLL
jgi:UDP-N-acetylmuramate--alanine ligase